MSRDATRVGHDYAGTSAEGNSRQHNGNIYSTVNTIYVGTTNAVQGIIGVAGPDSDLPSWNAIRAITDTPIRLLRRKDDGSFAFAERKDGPVRYAILSHTWSRKENEEVTYSDICDGTGQNKPGVKKLELCASLALEDDLEYFWCDTCCINKEDKDERKQAIVSMFRWYENSQACYVYLEDVEMGSRGRGSSQWRADFRECEWFTRGWTLQELLAPKSLHFFSNDKRYLGERSSLWEEICSATRIPAEVIKDPFQRFRYTVDKRKSWARSRETTEVEDEAYSLMGLLDVIIEPAYGEGRRMADIRLSKAVKEDTQNRRRGMARVPKRAWLAFWIFLSLTALLGTGVFLANNPTEPALSTPGLDVLSQSIDLSHQQQGNLDKLHPDVDVPSQSTVLSHQHQESSDKLSPDAGPCEMPTANISWVSIWNLRSATAMCSAPWWAAFALVLKSALVYALHVSIGFAAFSFYYDFLTASASKASMRLSTLLTLAVIAIALVCGGQSITRWTLLIDAGCADCMLTAWSIYQLPVLLFRAGPFVWLSFCLLRLTTDVNHKDKDTVLVLLFFLLNIYLQCRYVW